MTEKLDLYEALAVVWGCTRDEAKVRAARELYAPGAGSDVEAMLRDRAGKHGEFEDNARATWALMDVLAAERNWPTLPAGMRHSLYMIMHKASRIVCGDPTWPDHWDDIEGYARLPATRLRSPVQPYPSDDIYSALARGWGVSRGEAMERLRTHIRERGAATVRAEAGLGEAAQTRPATPEDGGQHARAGGAGAAAPRPPVLLTGEEPDPAPPAVAGWRDRRLDAGGDGLG